MFLPIVVMFAILFSLKLAHLGISQILSLSLCVIPKVKLITSKERTLVHLGKQDRFAQIQFIEFRNY